MWIGVRFIHRSALKIIDIAADNRPKESADPAGAAPYFSRQASSG
jgi:hypothetical protein